MPGSRHTLLRRVRRVPAPAASPPCNIGIDDEAKRKGHTYGTIVVARDRAEAYASGVTQGAPDAVQVADRWHLVKHLREAVGAALREHPMPRRLTVAVSRPKRKLIVLASQALFSLMPANLDDYERGALWKHLHHACGSPPLWTGEYGGYWLRVFTVKAT